MRRLLTSLLIAGALAAPAAAQATTIQTSDTSQPWQAWTDQAQVPTWDGTLPFTAASDYFQCGGFDDAAGCSSLTPNVDQTTGQIMPQGTPLAAVSTEVDAGQDLFTVRGTLYHELGQVFWAEYLTPADEAEFMSIVGLGTDISEWGNWLYGTIVANGQTYHFPPYEWFAEGYRYCAEYGINQPVNVDDYEGLWYPGDQPGFASQQRQVCALIDQIGLRHGVATPAQSSGKPDHLTGRVVRVHVRTGRPVKVRVRTGRRQHRTAAVAKLTVR